MSRCLLTYELTSAGEYSPEGLRKLNRRLENLKRFPYNREEQIREVQKHAGKISIQGVQPKLSAKLSVKHEQFVLVERFGEYIIKPQVLDYPELPQNEDLTMHLARIAGLETPWHGLLKAKDNSLLYAIKRFDRLPKKKKLAQEDFAQLMGATRSTKYAASMEKVCEVVEEFASFPIIELEKIFNRVLFSFLIGNEDMHLKNFSIQTTPRGVRQLTPVYDLLNTTIAMPAAEEELALELNQKKREFNRSDFIEYFGPEHCYIKKEKGNEILQELLSKVATFETWIDHSFLSEGMKEKYKILLHERALRLSS